MQYLFRAKIIIGLLFVFCLSGIAQNTSRSINYYGFKKKSHYFGLTLAYNNSGFKIEHSKRFINNANYRINDGVSSPGLTLGMITNFKIGQYFDYRILPSIALVYRKLSYQPLPQIVVLIKIGSRSFVFHHMIFNMKLEQVYSFIYHFSFFHLKSNIHMV